MSETLEAATAQSQIEEAMRSVLAAVGEDPTREGLLETPARVARMYFELFEGLSEDPSVHLKKQFLTDSNSMVIIDNIPFYSTCEHHLVPFHGVCHVGYLPGRAKPEVPVGFEMINVGNEQFFEDQSRLQDKTYHPTLIKKQYRVAGLSKFARVVNGFARRPQVQETLTHQIASCIQNALDPKGVIVVMKAQHLCMSMRGVKSVGAVTTTSAVRGMFDTNVDDVKGEFFRLLSLG